MYIYINGLLLAFPACDNLRLLSLIDMPDDMITKHAQALDVGIVVWVLLLALKYAHQVGMG